MMGWMFLVACNGGDGGSSGDDSTAKDDSATDDSATDDSGPPPVDADRDGFSPPEDCDDGDETIHPGADEHCDGIDEDCDEHVDDDPVDGATFHPDLDHDSYGDAAVSIVACDKPTDHVTDGTDCDDASAEAHPGATEVGCTAIDEDCDGLWDEEPGPEGLLVGGTRYDDPQPAFNAAAPGDTVYVCPGTYEWDDEPIINKDLTFRGSARDASRVVLDGLETFRILLVTGKLVTIQDITFSKGHAEGDSGGAILGFGHLVVEDCVFDFNGVEYDGGAIDISDTTLLEVRRSTFTNNFAGGGGAAIHADGSSMVVTIEDSTFRSNTTIGSGSAISIGRGDDWTLDIRNSAFEENLSEDGEGTIARNAPAGDDVAVVTITDSTFVGNEANANVVLAMFAEELTLSFDGTAIRDNVAQWFAKSATAIQAFGGTTLDVSFTSAEITGNEGLYQAVNVSWDGTTLRSVDTDWGSGASENEGGDLISRCGVHDDLGAGESFTCTAAGVWSEP